MFPVHVRHGFGGVEVRRGTLQVGQKVRVVAVHRCRKVHATCGPDRAGTFPGGSFNGCGVYVLGHGEMILVAEPPVNYPMDVWQELAKEGAPFVRLRLRGRALRIRWRVHPD